MSDKIYIVLITLVFAVMAAAIMWAGHEESVRRDHPLPGLTQEQKADVEIKYFQDTRTHFCFAGNFDSWNTVYLITNVPCTPEVLGLVKPLP